MTQYHFPLELAEDYSAGSFFVAEANAEAFGLIERWPDWGSAYGLLIYGEEGCGKTHLAHLWQQKSQAMLLTPDLLQSKAYLNVPVPSFVVEQLEQIGAGEEAFFHFLNHVQQQKGYLLCTSRVAPVDLPLRIRDVRSRVMGLLQVKVSPPDEALLASLMLKRFSDKQLKVSPDVIAYAVNRIERSYRAANQLIQAIDAKALEQKREITIPLVREILAA